MISEEELMDARALARQGYTYAEIGRLLGRDRRTVKRYLETGAQPVHRRKRMRIPVALRDRARQIIDVTDAACREHLDDEYGRLARALVARLARQRPSPLVRGDVKIWAAGVIYALGQVNFLFDRTQRPHMTTDQLAEALGVVKTTMANKAGLINRMLEIGIYEPELMRAAMVEQHPMTWMVMVDGVIVDARTLPPEVQDEARRRGFIPRPRHVARGLTVPLRRA